MRLRDLLWQVSACCQFGIDERLLYRTMVESKWFELEFNHLDLSSTRRW